MSRSLVILYVVAGTIVVFCLYVFFSLTHLDINSGTVSVGSVSVSDTRIDITVSPSASAIGYTGFKANFSNGILIVTLQGSYLDTPISRTKPFKISTENIYGNIKEIYLTTLPKEDNKLIWKDGVIVK